MTTLMENTGDLSIQGIGVSTFKLLPGPNMEHVCHSKCEILLQPGGQRLPLMRLLRKGKFFFFKFFSYSQIISMSKKVSNLTECIFSGHRQLRSGTPLQAEFKVKNSQVCFFLFSEKRKNSFERIRPQEDNYLQPNSVHFSRISCSSISLEWCNILTSHFTHFTCFGDLRVFKNQTRQNILVTRCALSHFNSCKQQYLKQMRTETNHQQE